MNFISPHDINPESQILIDVRSPNEFDAAHIQGSYNVPLARIDDHLDVLRHVENAVIICRTDNRSTNAAKTLRGAGTDVSVLRNGINGWQDKGQDLVFGKTSTWSIQRQVQFTAGTLTVLGTILGVVANPWFLAIPGFIGIGLTYAGVTDTCGMALLLARAPWNNASDHVDDHVSRLSDTVND